MAEDVAWVKSQYNKRKKKDKTEKYSALTFKQVHSKFRLVLKSEDNLRFFMQ